MKISGIICEYNPFHNGHMYHIQKTRENGATHIVAVMSGNFVQRGDVAIIDKFERARAAVRCGADLVIELPVAYALSGAEGFARGAMYILNSMGCIDEVSFGSESGDMNKILSAVQASLSFENTTELRTLMESGMTYPAAIQQLATQKYGRQVGDIFEGANNLLAIEYIKATSYLNSKITPFTIARKNAGHDQPDIICNFASASFIRQNVKENAYSDLMPEPMYEALSLAVKEGRTANVANLEKAILYKMRMMTPIELRNVPDVAQGLEHRIYEARTASTVNEMMNAIKTKRYTMSRIRRILMNCLLGITKDDTTTPPLYGRILAINERGTDILNIAKGKSRIPLATSLAKLSEINAVTRRCAELEALSTDIYGVAMDKVQPVELDYRTKVGITKSL